MTQGEQLSEKAPLSNEGPKTLKQIFDEVFDSLAGDDAARDALTTLEGNYDEKRLDIKFDTQREISELKQEVEAALANDSKIDEMEKGRIDANVDRERIEDTINSKVEGIETVSDLRGLSFDKLLELESQYEGILFYAFTDFVNSSTKMDFENYYSWYKAPKTGDSFKINFYGNQDAENRIGAGDLLPPTVRGITVYPSGQQNDADATKRVSTRRLGLKGDGNHKNTGFFDAGGYIAVYSGHLIVVGGVEMSFDEKYRGKEGADGKLGALDFAAYDSDHAGADREFVSKLPATSRRGKYHSGGALDFESKDRLGLNIDSRSLRSLLREKPDVLTYAKKYREKYAADSGIDIPESVMLSIAKTESSFNFDIMNTQGSGAGGLFQFMPGTWDSFLDANPWARAKLENDSVWGKLDQQQWRFNPEIMMAAGYWYATENMKNIYANRSQFTCKKFKKSPLYHSSPDEKGQIHLTEDDTWIIYLCHHDGLGGAKKMLRYKSLREQGNSERDAAAQTDLAGWQRWEILGYKPMRYNKDNVVADKHWRTLVSGGRVLTAKRYKSVLGGVDSPSVSEWGWGGEVASEAEAVPVRSSTNIDYYRNTSNLDSISKSPSLEGKTLYVGSSSTVGYSEKVAGDKHVIAKVGRPINQMVRKLKRLPVKELKSCTRVVLQGGVKNQPDYEASVKAMREMVLYIRTKAPGVKIYVQESLPWNEENRDKIQKFNGWLNSGELNVDGVIPLYQIMSNSNGLWDKKFGDSSKGKWHALHCERYDRYAGVVADWVTKKESSENV